jgi:hypothetical protein
MARRLGLAGRRGPPVGHGTQGWPVDFLLIFKNSFYSCRYIDNLFFISFKKDLVFFIGLTCGAPFHLSK